MLFLQNSSILSGRVSVVMSPLLASTITGISMRPGRDTFLRRSDSHWNHNKLYLRGYYVSSIITLPTDSKVFGLVRSKTIAAATLNPKRNDFLVKKKEMGTYACLKKTPVKDPNRSYPAISQICRLILVVSSHSKVLIAKSAPIVILYVDENSPIKKIAAYHSRWARINRDIWINIIVFI